MQRIKRLEKLGVIKNYTVNINYALFGFDYHVSIMIKIKNGRPGDVQQLSSILDMVELEALYSTTGDWDILSLWRIRDREHLNEILRILSDHPNIERKQTNTILYTYKSPRKFNPLK